MYTVKNERDLASAYEDLYIFGVIIPDFAQRSKASAEHVLKIKRAIRQYHKKQSDRRMVQQDEYGYTVLISVPAECGSVAEAEEWFDAEERIEFHPGPYDCSGQAFTGWHHIGVLGGKLVCWHRVDFDV